MITFALLTQALPVAPEAHGTKELIGAATLVLLNVGQMLKSHLRDRKRGGGTETLSRIERKVDGMDEKLERFMVAQTEVNHVHDTRIREVSAHVIGPDGKNGLRSRVTAIEERLPLDIGAYRPPRTV